jgi:Tfp pilus assembly protein FimT
MTTVELMVVLVLVALLAFASYPMIENAREIMISKGAAEQVASAIRQARQYAITEGANRCIKFGTTPVTQYEIRGIVTDATPDCASGTVRGTETIANGAAVMTPSDLGLLFDPVGRITPATTLDVSITVDTQPASCESTITVTPFGGVRVSKC